MKYWLATLALLSASLALAEDFKTINGKEYNEAESAQHATPDFAQQLEITLDEHVNRFAERVQKQLEERESILKGKHTPGPAELSAMREIHFHEAFLAGTAIIAIVLFAIVWRRFK